MKTKLLLTISIICLLLASTQAAIPYEYFPNRSEADGETPGAQIPNCIHQRGSQCYACGPDTSKTPAVPLFPNGLNQCIPNPTGSGCNRFLDVQGNVCDVNWGCNCKFALNSVATTCVTSTIPNCFILAADGTCNQCIGLNREAEYKDQFGQPQNLNQKTPVGGGISDYGRSFDGKTCIDNLANGNPNCLEYLNATSCNKCDDNYVLVQTGSSLRKCVRIPGFDANNANNKQCLAFTLDGTRCLTCRATYVLNSNGNGVCVGINLANFSPAATDQATSENCLRYAKGPDGKDDTTRCLQCVKFSFQLYDRSCSFLLTNEHQVIDYKTGEMTEIPGSDCRLFYQALIDDQTNPDADFEDRQAVFNYCLVKKAVNDYYIPQPTTPAAVSTVNSRIDLGCYDFDSASGKCLTCWQGVGLYLNTINGSCNSNSSGTCPLAGCQTANGYAYCTECERGYYPVPVDGMCVKYNLVDTTTQEQCKTVTNGECTECDPEYFLDIQDTLTNPSTNRNKCRLLETNSDCSVWKAGRCVECSEQAQNLVNGKCVWAPDTTFGGVPGCATHESDGKCLTAYPNAFLSKDKTFTRIISNECASYDEDGNCTSVNNINYVLNFNYPTGLFVATLRGDAGFCDKTYDNSCTCVTCKPTFTLSATQTCPINKDGSNNNILPDTVIRGCIQFATASTCEICRSPDFILTADGKCYDLKFMKYSSVNGWKNLFLRIITPTKSGNAANPSAAAVYNPDYYEACTEASTISACKTCFSGRTTNILLTIASADAAYFGSDITYCHDNTNTNFKSLTASKSVLVNDGNTASRDTEVLQLDRVAGCLTYTSLVLGTCATCGANLTKSADNTICYKSDGADGDGNGEKNCGTVDTSGSCLTCLNTQDYIYDSTLKSCQSKYSSTYQNCMSIDTTTLKCLTCNPSHVFHVDNKECWSVLDMTTISGCNTGQCAIGTATYVPQVTGPPVVNGYLQVASCGKGYNYDSTNKNCIRNKSDWTTSVAEIDAQTGYFLSCNTGYTLLKTTTYTICIPTIANCKTYNFNNNLVSCTACGIDANGNPTLPANQNLAGLNSLCIPAQNYLPNCQIYNLSGSGCLKCNSNTQNLEAQGCKLPPNCSTIDPNTLRCSACTNGKLSPQGDCILTIPRTWADSSDCEQAFNATHCAECDSSQIIAIDDSNNDNQYGVGECIDPSTIGCPITGCELILRNQNQLNCKLTTHECIRCQIGYSMLGGQCYSNTDSEQRFPHECVNVEYDEDRRAYVCTECDFGFAITTDRRKCIPNYGPCSYLDSTDCASYDLAQGHEEVQIECAVERESSSSLIISATLMIILNIIFFSI